MSKDNSGPAFPAGNDAIAHGTMGMTLRDYFAAGVISALVSGPDQALEKQPNESVEDAIARYWMAESSMAYVIADAMLRARQQ